MPVARVLAKQPAVFLHATDTHCEPDESKHTESKSAPPHPSFATGTGEGTLPKHFVQSQLDRRVFLDPATHMYVQKDGDQIPSTSLLAAMATPKTSVPLKRPRHGKQKEQAVQRSDLRKKVWW